MSTLAVGRNYAAALFELASRDAQAERFADYLRHLAALYAEDPRFRAFMDTPRISRDAKQTALRRALGEELPELLMRFLMVVLQRRRQGALPAISEAYQSLLDDRAGRVRARVTLPFEPDEQLKRDIVAAIQRRVEQTVVPHFAVDPSILGGLVVQVRDQRLDASVRRQLERMKWELVEGPGQGPSPAG